MSVKAEDIQPGRVFEGEHGARRKVLRVSAGAGIAVDYQRFPVPFDGGERSCLLAFFCAWADHEVPQEAKDA